VRFYWFSQEQLFFHYWVLPTGAAKRNNTDGFLVQSQTPSQGLWTAYQGKHV